MLEGRVRLKGARRRGKGQVGGVRARMAGVVRAKGGRGSHTHVAVEGDVDIAVIE